MKKLLLLGLILLLVSCEQGKVYCEWEIIYPDTTIMYADTLDYESDNEESPTSCVISSYSGSNCIRLNGSDNYRFSKGTTTYPISSTCPMRIIKYKFISNE